MNRSVTMQFKGLLVLLCFITTAVRGQEQTKKYQERFLVNTETVLDLNTKNTDVEFQTWDKDEIAIEATIVVTGATKEEADAYFKNNRINISGNSEKVSVRTGSMHRSYWGPEVREIDISGGDIGIRIDSFYTGLPDINFDRVAIDMAILDEMPPIPPLSEITFDYQAFEKDGEAYLNEWKEQFSKNFDADYELQIKRWGKRARERTKRKKQKEKALKKRLEERNAANAERTKARIALLEERTEALAKRRAAERAKRIHLIKRGNRANSYYISSKKGEAKNYTVKKYITIKMPKNLKINMNVRHGEIKLAENTRNINANLAYANLNAFSIGGKETTIVASYSPVMVKRWNEGRLRADYSDAVDLGEVVDLQLSSTSSDVTIHRLLEKAQISSAFGPLQVKFIGKDFERLDISLNNAELFCNVPEPAFTFLVTARSSKVDIPENFEKSITQNGNVLTFEGYHLQKNNNKKIVINSDYSDIVINR
ncbi:hypothetical protein [Maribacter sp. 2-571]|uniref:hypothetical protein n=1 Tax=Maribacter sp. 2-571 TaxID=3417569 RepID=UPI003D3413CD